MKLMELESEVLLACPKRGCGQRRKYMGSWDQLKELEKERKANTVGT